jgi:phenazine biosynthesis protein phzE
VRKALAARNQRLNALWFASGSSSRAAPPAPGAPRVLVLDAEDAFTAMLGHHVRSLGYDVQIQSCGEAYSVNGFACVIAGPGPGDPLALDDPRIARMHGIIESLLAGKVPFMAVCLSHQILCSLLGLPLRRHRDPRQGVQRDISLFGRRELVGFYNTFSSWCTSDRISHPGRPGEIEVCRDEGTSEVHALRGTGFCSLQFHLESVLTQNGQRIAAELLAQLSRTRPWWETAARAAW